MYVHMSPLLRIILFIIMSVHVSPLSNVCTRDQMSATTRDPIIKGDQIMSLHVMK